MRRPVNCEFCDLDYPYCEIVEHKDMCGSRTDKCEKCNGIVMLKDMAKHMSSGCRSGKTIKSANRSRTREDLGGYSDPYDMVSSIMRNFGFSDAPYPGRNMGRMSRSRMPEQSTVTIEEITDDPDTQTTTASTTGGNGREEQAPNNGNG